MVGTPTERAMDFYKGHLAVIDAVRLNNRKPTDELTTIILDTLVQRLGLATKNHSQGEKQAVVGVTLDRHAMIQVVLAGNKVIYTGYNTGQYDITQQQPIWEPRVEGTKYWASINRNSIF